MPDESTPTASQATGDQGFLDAVDRARRVARNLPVVGGYVRFGEAMGHVAHESGLADLVGGLVDRVGEIVSDFDLMPSVAATLVALSERAEQCSTDVGVADKYLEIGKYAGCAFGDRKLDAVATLDTRARRSTRPTRQTLADVAAWLKEAARLVELDRTNKARANAEAEKLLTKVRASQKRAEEGDTS